MQRYIFYFTLLANLKIKSLFIFLSDRNVKLKVHFYF